MLNEEQLRQVVKDLAGMVEQGIAKRLRITKASDLLTTAQAEGETTLQSAIGLDLKAELEEVRVRLDAAIRDLTELLQRNVSEES